MLKIFLRSLVLTLLLLTSLPLGADVHVSVREEQGLFISLQTERLIIRSIIQDDCDSYESLFCDPEVMTTFRDGNPYDRDVLKYRLSEIWVKKWHDQNPFGFFSVFGNEGNFLGCVVLNPAEEPGDAELGYLFLSQYWGRGFAFEAVQALIEVFVPLSQKQGYLTNGEPLKRIIATARTDNIASIRILEKLDMSLIKIEEKYGFLRGHYVLDLRPH